jgi:hypothetical protein
MPIIMENPTITHQEGRKMMGNNTVITSHLVVPNPYTLLSLLPLQTSWFPCLDLEDTFFWLHLAPVSQPLFIFEWEDPIPEERHK